MKWRHAEKQNEACKSVRKSNIKKFQHNGAF